MDHYNAEVRATKSLGKGVYARGPIRAGEVVAEWDGLIYDVDFEGWNDELENHVIQFAPHKWRDSTGIARYLNHSCVPNCGIKELFKIVAMRDIRADEELTWDYDMSEANQDYPWQMQCKCGARSCRKVIRGYRQLPAAERKKYAGFISEWLLADAASSR